MQIKEAKRKKVLLMDLFNLEETLAKNKLGFRLQRLEVYNWGTFDEKVWTLNLNGDTSLLTGDVGSGKSTLVDALLTLLVSPRKITYNKAADASARERSILSYVRGYFGQKRTLEGMGQPESLRDMNQYSVILGVFSDENLAATVTLAQVFWFSEEQRKVLRFYVVGSHALSITRNFSHFGTDMRSLKKQLSQNSAVSIYEDYQSYARDFRRKFGIQYEQALDLFQQTISMKKVDALTDFVRQNMLEPPDTQMDVECLLGHFYDLDIAYGIVMKAKKQQSMLMPIARIGGQYQLLQARQKDLEVMQRGLEPWFASLHAELFREKLEKFNEEYDTQTKELNQLDTELTFIGKICNDLRVQIAQNGGQRLEHLKFEIEQEKRILEERKHSLEKFTYRAEELALPIPTSEAEFKLHMKKIEQLRQEINIDNEVLADDLDSYNLNLNEVKQEQQQINNELASLNLRQSSIPSVYVEIRKTLCENLDLMESELPFAGELMEVNEEESEWEGAIERLLHGFGISLLIPDAHYGEVVEWIEKTQLQLKLIYYRVKYGETYTIFSESKSKNTVIEKIHIKEESPFANWLKTELKQRFQHICCQSMTDFRQANYAITKSGQIKVNGKRHEKDDRHRLDDRRQYILGFSNQRKMAALELEKTNLSAEITRWKKQIKLVREKMTTHQKRRSSLDYLESFDTFTTLDVSAILQKLQKKQDDYTETEKANELLYCLQKKLVEAEQQYKNCQEKIVLVRDSRSRAGLQRDNCCQQIIEAEEIIARLSQAEFAQASGLLNEQKNILMENFTVKIENISQVKIQFQEKLGQLIKENLDAISEKNTELTGKMTMYNHCYPQETNSIDAGPESLNEYIEILTKLETDGLPNFEVRFRSLLRENTIHQIALFQGKLKLACETIETRIGRINKSLYSIDYNDGRYIRIEHGTVTDNEIKEFRIKLKACTDSILTGSEDEQYAEAKFLQVKEIIERFKGESEEDIKWRNKVIDVRNWYSFAASERWRQTGEEYEHYTDSGGKSGGQKEKLAYTILAASLVYNFGLESQDGQIQSFRFVVIDEAFLKSSDESATFGLTLFKKLQLQLLVVTPLLKIATIEPFVTHVGFVYQDDVSHRSSLRNLTIEELREEREDFLIKAKVK